MKTLNQICAAQFRCLMRVYAMGFRVAISPQSELSLTRRGIIGFNAIRDAVRMRKQAEALIKNDLQKKCVASSLVDS